MSSADNLDLSQHPLFKEYRNFLPKRNDKRKRCNLVVVKETVLFTWDFKNNCVVSLNIKAAKQQNGKSVMYQKLLPNHQPLFTPEFLFTSEDGNFLAIAGSNGVLILQLPSQVPPDGNFGSNSELVCCRSHSLDERLLACSDFIQVRQARFHPNNNNHVFVLTSDNMLRLYRIDEKEALGMGAYQVGQQPGTKVGRISYTDVYRETAVDFDFGHPVMMKSYDLDCSLAETSASQQSLVTLETSRSNIQMIPSTLFEQKQNQEKKLDISWPIYILRENFTIYTITIDLNSWSKPVLRGPLVMSEEPEKDCYNASSLICLNTTPQIIVIANEAGILTHCVSLELDEFSLETMRSQSNSIITVPDTELLVLEVVELEMGLTMLPDHPNDKCNFQLMLHKDESRGSRYFVTHAAGVHSINLDYMEDLLEYIASPDGTEPTSDIFINPSVSDYLICTKTSVKSTSNPIIGFSLNFSPPSIITLLGDGNIVTLAMTVTTPLMVPEVKFNKEDTVAASPLKKMLSEPFEEYIRKILKKRASRPLLKLSLSSSGDTTNECIELLNQATKMFCDEQFSNHTNAREEIIKRANTLCLFKSAQNQEIDKIIVSKEELRRDAEQLAERYEDIKDKQEQLVKRVERVAMLMCGRLSENPQAQRQFMEEMQDYNKTCMKYQRRIDKLKTKNGYQKQQIQNWKALQNKQNSILGESQGTLIKSNLLDINKQISSLRKQIITMSDTLQEA